MNGETLYLLPDESIVKDLPEGVECYSVLHPTFKEAKRDVYYRLAWLFGSELADRMFSDAIYELCIGLRFWIAEYQGASYYALYPMPVDVFLGYVGRADYHQLLAKELIATRSLVQEAATHSEQVA